MSDHPNNPYPERVYTAEEARLLSGARMFQYDETLERAADLYESGDRDAWARLPVHVQDRSGLYMDARRAHRAAVDAGLIDDNGRPTR